METLGNTGKITGKHRAMRSEYTNKETEVMSPGETTRQEQIKEETSEEELYQKKTQKEPETETSRNQDTFAFSLPHF